jgi:hypothetical protein
MKRSMMLAAPTIAITGCGSTAIPLYDKAGATRDEEFHDRAACVKQRGFAFLPDTALTHCMQARGYEFLGYE